VLGAVSDVLAGHVEARVNWVLAIFVLVIASIAALTVRSERDRDEVAVEEGDRIADELARQTYRRWRAEARVWGLKTVAPVHVTWRWAPRHSLSANEVLRAAEPSRLALVTAPRPATKLVV
jgi:hypothetical protein